MFGVTPKQMFRVTPEVGIWSHSGANVRYHSGAGVGVWSHSGAGVGVWIHSGTSVWSHSEVSGVTPELE